MLDRIGITGAPGCGVTTLGMALAARLGAISIDTDDHYWVDTDPPYRDKQDVPERLRRIAAEQARTGRWVLSGTLQGWAESAMKDAQLIVFLEAPTDIRMARLRRREQDRFGDSLLPGGAMHDIHRAFLEWAAQYEEGTQGGRSRPKHERWLAGLEIPVLRLDSTQATDQLVAEVLRRA
jgi:adenylate kinase family enzyme